MTSGTEEENNNGIQRVSDDILPSKAGMMDYMHSVSPTCSPAPKDNLLSTNQLEN